MRVARSRPRGEGERERFDVVSSERRKDGDRDLDVLDDLDLLLDALHLDSL